MSAGPPVLPVAPVEAPPARGGCLRAGLIGCGIVALLCVLIFVAGVLYIKKNPGALVDFAMRGIENNFGPDVTEQDKKELREAVEEFKVAVRSGRVTGDRAGGWQRSFSMKSSSRKLSHEDVQDIIRAFREAAGVRSAPATAPTLAPMVATPSP
ncbi:MAG: hypothetical protein ACRD00_00365 [Thermoanaerobaculia bacterium]